MDTGLPRSQLHVLSSGDFHLFMSPPPPARVLQNLIMMCFDSLTSLDFTESHIVVNTAGQALETVAMLVLSGTSERHGVPVGFELSSQNPIPDPGTCI